MRYLPLLLLLATSCRSPVLAQPTEKVRLILDSDTANEIDDLYAIAYLFAEESIDWVGLNSAQWFHHMSGDSTVYQSQRLNEELLTLAGRLDLPHPLGADTIMGQPWGGYDPRDSPAARLIIQEARRAGAGKLVVMCIGASTNLASAIALAPDIKDKITAYVLGFQYDTTGRYWNKDEFNIRRDLNAANYLLNAEGLELHVMPTSTARQYEWRREPTFERLDRSGPIGAYLKARWQNFAPGAESWIMWDVALLQAFLHPKQATQIQVTTPPENTRRQVWIYTDIDEEAMARDYWQRLLTYE
ncbi:nucleoside hydrolase [Neolewinella litorea]|uniref:Nucleoside hydrolase n=1 Tax=Neolewinella litorea TaxID=2562452 RepID=A0A4S4N6D6_9BACT|nr:nucleoside hydrolase [Neolewinella litorea]THH34609.1 nucleoside hydrolase [Neolewinella litorea]